jgi:predicted NBD/HSP70 family sugar kinase
MRRQIVWGVDLGGTKTEVVVCEVASDSLQPLIRRRAPTGRERGYRAIIDGIGELVSAVAGELGISPERVGVGTPGVNDPITKQLKNSNTLCLNGERIQEDLARCLNVPVIVANDANCFALAEARYGAGGGVVLDRKVRFGYQGIAGEWGHNVLDRLGPECYCGKSGCVETILSGPALEERFYQSSGRRASLVAIAELVEQGDRNAIELKEYAQHQFVRAIATVINILDPDRIVLGGGVSNLDWFYEAELFRGSAEIFNNEPRIPIVRNQLGDSAGVYGAALLVAERTGE